MCAGRGGPWESSWKLPPSSRPDRRPAPGRNIQGIRNEFGKKLDDLSDGMNTRIDGLTLRIDKTREELTAKIDDLTERVDNGQRETADKIERTQIRAESGQKVLAEKIDGVKDSLGQSKVWALGLYSGAAGALLLVMAHGFKWL